MLNVQVGFHLPFVNVGPQSQKRISDYDFAMASSVSCMQDNVHQLNSGLDKENNSVATYSQAYEGSAPYDIAGNWMIHTAVEDLSSIGSDVANQWKACFSQEQQFLPQPGCESGDLTLLQAGTPEPWLSTGSQLRHDLHLTALPGDNPSNYEEIEESSRSKNIERAPRRKRGPSGPPRPERLTKGTKRIVACARCWTLKRKVRGDRKSSCPTTQTSA